MMERAEEAGIEVLSITDHNVLSVPANDTGCVRAGLRLIRGCEISCQSPWATDEEVHILAYFPHEDAPAGNIEATLARVRSVLRGRNLAIAHEAGLDLNVIRRAVEGQAEPLGPLFGEQVEAYMLNVYLRQLEPDDRNKARARVDEATLRLCAAGRFPPLPSPEWVLEGIAGAGGYASLAHPTRYRASSGQLVEFVRRLAGSRQLHALEGGYGPRPQDCSQISELARQFGLRISGGSDSHDASTPGEQVAAMLAAAGADSFQCTILELFEGKA